MNHVFFIVEGKRDVQILSYIIELIFPKDNKRFHYYLAHGFSGIISSIRPILDLVSDDSKVIVVFDADTINPSMVEEKIDFVKNQIENGVVDHKLKIMSFVPTIEEELGLNKYLIIHHINTKSTECIKALINEHIDTIKDNKTVKEIIDYIKS